MVEKAGIKAIPSPSSRISEAPPLNFRSAADVKREKGKIAAARM
jgi:hypothetical protein